MIDRVASLVSELRAAVGSLDAATLSAGDAARLVELLSEGERICAAGRTLAAGRVTRSAVWSDEGFRTPGQWMAARMGVSISQAVICLETARRLERLPETRDQFATGLLSEAQASDIASAAEAVPAAEASLLEMAASSTVTELRDRCRDVRASARPDEDAAERIRRSRYLKSWTDRDGAVRLDGRFAPDDGAKLLACVSAQADQLAVQARRSGHKEPAAAYSADALIALATGQWPPRAVIHVEVERSAFERGRVEPGERCRIRGVGPVPVAVARRLACEGAVKVVERSGVDVTRIEHVRRSIPAHVRTALEARDPTCVVPGCEVRSGLEIDHITPLAAGGATRLDNLARLCRYHHGEKTHRGWRLKGRPGGWIWTRGSTVSPAGEAATPRLPPARAP